MRDDFCVFILTHRRPNAVKTYDLWRRRGYTGKMYLVIDDGDPTADEDFQRYGNEVLVFNKKQVRSETEFYDNFENVIKQGTIVPARNACWELSERVGCRFFMQLDDDYHGCMYRRVGKSSPDAVPSYRGWSIHSMDDVLEAMVSFVETTPALAIAMSQGGDHFGGSLGDTDVKLKRKAMNTWVCDNSKPFRFTARLNEDVTTYVMLGAMGKLFFTHWGIQVDQPPTQSQAGGVTELYKKLGTYAKSFYTVMAAPSCVTVRRMGRTNQRLHHSIKWNNAVPKLVSESLRKV